MVLVYLKAIYMIYMRTNIEFIQTADKIKTSWTILPKTCAQTYRTLWLVLAFKVKSGGETRWFDPVEFLILDMIITEST